MIVRSLYNIINPNKCISPSSVLPLVKVCIVPKTNSSTPQTNAWGISGGNSGAFVQTSSPWAASKSTATALFDDPSSFLLLKWRTHTPFFCTLFLHPSTEHSFRFAPCLTHTLPSCALLLHPSTLHFFTFAPLQHFKIIWEDEIHQVVNNITNYIHFFLPCLTQTPSFFACLSQPSTLQSLFFFPPSKRMFMAVIKCEHKIWSESTPPTHTHQLTSFT